MLLFFRLLTRDAGTLRLARDFRVFVFYFGLKDHFGFHAIILKLVTVGEVLGRSVVVEEEHLLLGGSGVTNHH